MCILILYDHTCCLMRNRDEREWGIAKRFAQFSSLDALIKQSPPFFKSHTWDCISENKNKDTTQQK